MSKKLEAFNNDELYLKESWSILKYIYMNITVQVEDAEEHNYVCLYFVCSRSLYPALWQTIRHILYYFPTSSRVWLPKLDTFGQKCWIVWTRVSSCPLPLSLYNLHHSWSTERRWHGPCKSTFWKTCSVWLQDRNLPALTYPCQWMPGTVLCSTWKLHISPLWFRMNQSQWQIKSNFFLFYLCAMTDTNNWHHYFTMYWF